jgi:hypothetical protein
MAHVSKLVRVSKRFRFDAFTIDKGLQTMDHVKIFTTHDKPETTNTTNSQAYIRSLSQG